MSIDPQIGAGLICALLAGLITWRIERKRQLPDVLPPPVEDERDTIARFRRELDWRP